MELYEPEIHQKKLKIDYRWLKAMVKWSIDQKLRSRNFEARNGMEELKQELRLKIAGSNSLERGSGERWQSKAKGQCSKGDTCVF